MFDDDITVQADALPPDLLQQILKDAIERHMDLDALRLTLEFEKDDRKYLHDTLEPLLSDLWDD